jgi:hypothetical protein
MFQVFLGIVVMVLCALTTSCAAQEFRVYTKVWDLNSSDQPVSRSLTLWHAGKIYDVIHSQGEVTILEPAQRRCSIINPDKNVQTSVDFDELKHLLQVAEERLSQQIQTLEAKPNSSKEFSNHLRFQLHPQFTKQYDAQQHRLFLESKPLTYEVRGQEGVRAEAVDAYLDYADWACRLNFVLHPQPVFPTARLELNQQIRKLKLFPVEVKLRAQFDRPLQLKAEHELSWTLDTGDRDKIHHWESLLRNPKLQQLSLPEYQRAALSQSTAKAR